MQVLPTTAVICAEHAKLVRDLDRAKAEFWKAYETIMAAHKQKPLEIARAIFRRALRQCDAADLALLVHEMDHGCAMAAEDTAECRLV